VEDFSDLYQGYATKSMSQWNMQVSLLTAGHASPVHPTSKANIEAGGTTPEAGTIRNPLRRLALDLEGGAPALFTQVANRQSAMHVRRRALKN
jgi:hypothetical protein